MVEEMLAYDVASCSGRSSLARPDYDNDKPIILRPKERKARERAAEDWTTNETVAFSRQGE